MSDLAQNPFASTHSLDMNPFDDPTPIGPPNPVYSNGGQAEENIRAREVQLDRRQAELDAIARDLAQKQEHIRTHGRNNWPPFYPLIFHSIPDEIPEASRPLITRLYQLWLVLLGTLIINMVACILILIVGSSNGAGDLGGSIGYVFVIAPLSFLLWYRPIYNGYMKEQSLYYYLYFFFGGFHLLFSLYMIIGIPGTGSAGFIQTIQMYTRAHFAAAIVSTFATIGWTVQGAGNTFYYRQIWKHHNAAGHSFTKAKTELASHGAKAYFTRG